MAPPQSIHDQPGGEPGDGAASGRTAPAEALNADPEDGGGDSGSAIPVSQEELNAWRRGLTPQAEIWNGRLAMLGLSLALLSLVLVRLLATA